MSYEYPIITKETRLGIGNKKLVKVTEMLLRHIDRQERKRWVFQGDIWDLHKIYECLELDKVSKAKRLIRNLDTDPREQLPHFIWDWAEEDEDA